VSKHRYSNVVFSSLFFKETYFCYSKANIKLKLTDVNDNYPLFDNSVLVNKNYTSNECEEPIFEMFERCEENTRLKARIAMVNAVDLDRDKNITYKIAHSTDPRKSLAINKFTGKNKGEEFLK
jgi:hypothetical protein